MTLGSELACQPNKTYKRLPNLDRTTQMIERLIKTSVLASTPHRYFFSNRAQQGHAVLIRNHPLMEHCLRKKYLNVIAVFNGLDNVFT